MIGCAGSMICIIAYHHDSYIIQCHSNSSVIVIVLYIVVVVVSTAVYVASIPYM